MKVVRRVKMYLRWFRYEGQLRGPPLFILMSCLGGRAVSAIVVRVVPVVLVRR